MHACMHAQVNGQVTYNGETFDKFYPQRTAAYVDQVTLPTFGQGLNMANAFACLDVPGRVQLQVLALKKASPLLL